MQGSVHHELLLALSGYPGSIFRVSKEDSSIEVDPTLPFIHPSEVSLLNRICKLGTHYNRVRKFIAEQNAVTFSLPPILPVANPPPRSGLYLKALSCAIDRVLSDYRQALIDLEKKCISEPHLPLSYLQSQLEEFQLLLPALGACVSHVTSGQCQGSQILSYLYDQCSSGVPIIQNSFQRILCVCHGVLYKQLSAWMLHGLLLDSRGEFFIEEKASTSEKPKEPSDQGQVFVINHSLAPSYLPMRVLEKILFVGEAVTIFQTRTAASKEDQGTGGAPLTALTGAGSKFRSEQFRFGHMLTELQCQVVFQLPEFEKVIDSIRDCVAELLWSLLMEDSDLAGHLQLMKDFFLLGRGELFLAFIDLSQNFMNVPPSATTQHDVNVAFHQAMVRVGVDSERMAKQFQLVVPYTKQRGQGHGKSVRPQDSLSQDEPPQTSVWDHLTLTHFMEWPLPILFTPPVLTKYNTLFGVLLGLRRTQVSLHQCWALLMAHRDKLKALSQVWEIRTHMGFLIDNLQYYVQVDVLETQFSRLLDKVNATHDYETIKHAHEKYLTTLQSQLFLTQPSISHCLQEIMKLCNSFSSLLQGSKDLVLTTREQAQIKSISKDFNRQSYLFFDIVSGVKVHGSAPHLAQLLLRVDYNKYFSTTKHATPAAGTTV